MYSKAEKIWMAMMAGVLVVIAIVFVIIVSGFIELFSK